jgi:WD40 repeat protein
VIGEHGNLLMVYDSTSIMLKNQITAGGPITSFEFANNGREVAIVLKDLRIRFFSLSRHDGIFLRELNVVHRDCVNSIAMSANGGYMMTAGEDKLLKAWDYDA